MTTTYGVLKGESYNAKNSTFPNEPKGKMGNYPQVKREMR
jgi:hypothetical protein